jgi:hypothetical protein
MLGSAVRRKGAVMQERAAACTNTQHFCRRDWAWCFVVCAWRRDTRRQRRPEIEIRAGSRLADRHPPLILSVFPPPARPAPRCNGGMFPCFVVRKRASNLTLEKRCLLPTSNSQAYKEPPRLRRQGHIIYFTHASPWHSKPAIVLPIFRQPDLITRAGSRLRQCCAAFASPSPSSSSSSSARRRRR